jgi:hypothetical protein
MRRYVVPLLIAGCLSALLVACYGSVLFRGRQFGYRDAAHYYYPLYWRVQEEWDAGRVPLWEPEENAGMPLVGNPTAAVLYPGKIIYGLLPYPWAARIYVVFHTALAFAAMLSLLRGWGASWTASALSALAYAFGAPVLFQYCNIIFLVGAAWTPLGFRAADRWLRLGRRWGPIELAIVLAMLVLGGDPETAYVLGICAGGYALALAWGRKHEGRSPWGWGRWLVLALNAVVLAVAWVAGTLELAQRLPALRPYRGASDLPPLAFAWMRWVPAAVAGAWGVVGLVVLAKWWRRGRRRGALGAMLLGLVGSAALATSLSAAQLLPVLEFSAQTGRAAGEGPHDIYPFSLEPLRAVEFAWPNVFGTHFAGNRSWLEALPPEGRHGKAWVPSLYLGGLSLVLALGAMGFRGGHPGRGWLSAVAVVTLAASLGEYTGPLWWARWDRSIAAKIGPHDPIETTTIRLDAQLRDGDGSFYWTLATVLPGFRQFRYPSKLLSFTTLALAGLAGLGWDRLTAGLGRRRTAALAASLLAVGLIALAGAIVQHDRIAAALQAKAPKVSSVLGPFDAPGAFAEMRRALAHGTIVFAAAVALALWARRRPATAGAVALVVMTADLAVANAGCVLTVPQAMLDAEPTVVKIIREAERDAEARGEAEPGPYRVHRMPIWNPVVWRNEPPSNRVADFVAWERDTIQPKYGLMHGIEYTMTLGVAEIYDYEWFFGGFYRRLQDPETARWLGIEPGRRIVVFTRRSFDMWNSRYFVVPAHPNGWVDENRGYAAFLRDSEPVYPTPDLFKGPGGTDRRRRWLEREDFQVLRNRAAYPRAWVVHRGRFLAPIVGLDRAARDAPMQEILYSADPLWYEKGRTVFDPREMAWLDKDKEVELSAYLSNTVPQPSEQPRITRYEPQRIEIDVDLQRPGLVVLADIFYPGWTLTIDDQPAPIYRANRMMRGAAVHSGKHHLVFTYRPQSFRIGLALSAAGLAVMAVLGVAFAVRPGS